MMKRVGFVGWRGMVGSVLMQRMLEERERDERSRLRHVLRRRKNAP